MSDFERLSDDQTAALQRVLQLEKQLRITNWASVQARVRARLTEHTAARLTSPEASAVRSRAMLLRRQANALEEAQRTAAAARVLRFRLARLLNSWQS